MTTTSDAFDIITLRGLRAYASHGVHSFERGEIHPFEADISLWVDIRDALISDDVSKTVSYADIAQQAIRILGGRPVNLIETLAERIAEASLGYDRVAGVMVTVHKPEAPLAHQFADVSVTVRRGIAREFIEYDAVGVTRGPDAAPSVPLGDSIDEGGASEPVDVAAAPVVDAPAPGAEPASETALAPAPAAPVAPVAPVPVVEPDQVDEISQDLIPTPPFGQMPVRTRSSQHEDRGIAPGAEAAAVVLALGGNIGDVPETLRDAIADLMEVPGFEVTDVSPLVRTAPVLEPDQAPQDDYWNCVVAGRTTLEPMDLLGRTQAIEAAHGRERHEHWGARTLDIDVISYGDQLIETPELTVPHPRAGSRAFVIVPWYLMDPEGEFPRIGALARLAELVPGRDGVKQVVTDWLDQAEGVEAVTGQMPILGLDEPVGEPDDQAPARASEPDAITDGIPEVETPADEPASDAETTEPAPVGPEPAADGDFLFRKLWEQWSGEGHDVPMEHAESPADEGGPVQDVDASPVISQSAVPPESRRSTAERAQDAMQADMPALPSWESPRADVRIIDDANPTTPGGGVARRSILRPELPPDTPVGPIEDDETTSTTIIRGVTVRPTTTGTQPIRRSTDEDEEK